MERVDPMSVVKGHEKLTELFGGWPSFHDSEVTNLSIWRGDVDPDAGKYVFPVLTVKLVVQELVKSDDANALGPLTPVPRADVILRFHDVFELKLDDFNHENAIVDLAFSLLARGHYTNGEPLPPYIVVNFSRGFGLEATFKCFAAEVVSVAVRSGGDAATADDESLRTSPS
jgi:hypothetical protein